VDGVVLDPSTMPGGSQNSFNLGLILVHEVGHWLGLFHTFESGCSGSGDYVDDTPAEASPATGCPEVKSPIIRDLHILPKPNVGFIEADVEQGRNTCPQPGSDPVHNHMDYTNDSCRNHFTNGQISRMQSAYADKRVEYVSGNEGEEDDPPAGDGQPHGG
jgi:hypothetical protein